MSILESLIILNTMCVVSIHMPHKSKKHKLSWHSRVMLTVTTVYFIGCIIYRLIELLTNL